MIVEVDIGNTRLKWRLRGSSVVSAVPLHSWPGVLDCWREPRAHKIIVSCVAAVRLKAEFAAACATQLNVQPEFVSVQDGLRGVKLAYSDPVTLGVDRWLAMLSAGHSQADKNLVVVSAGSALTVDFLRAGGEHLGGLIMPGVGMSLASLVGGAAKLGDQAAALSAMDLSAGFAVGSSTQECIAAGLSLLYRGAMAELLAKCPFDVNSCSLVLAGGDAKILLSLCPEVVSVCAKPNLVLDGLSLIS